MTRSVLRLICLRGEGEPHYGKAWQAGLAPQIEAVPLTVRRDELAGDLARLLDERPYAILGRGPWALTAVDAGQLLARPPTQIIVVSCPAPDSGPVTVPMTAFAVPGSGEAEAAGMTRWRTVTTAPFTLRLLPAPEQALIDGWADEGTLLAIKEELRVWPS